MDQATLKPIIVGRIGSVYGIKGWLKVISFTEPQENILKYNPWLLQSDGAWQEVKVNAARIHGAGLVVQLEGCEDRDLARSYTNAEIAVERAQLPPLKKGEYYWTDLEGLTVVTVLGVTLGTIDHIISTGANDVVVVKGDKERLIPYLPDQVIKHINLSEKIMQVDWDPEF